MFDGIYNITFISNQNSFGEGILIKSNNSIAGGDIASVYQGRYSTDEVVLRVRRYNTDIPSVLGLEHDYELVIKIDDGIAYDSDEINLSAYVKDNKNLILDINVRFIESLSFTS